MYSRNSFGSFYPIDSSIHRLNPVIKLINFLIAVILVLLSDSVYIIGFLLGLVVIMILLSFVPYRYYFNTFWAIRYVYVLIAILCLIFGTTLRECFIYMAKIIIVIEYLNILAFTTSPSESMYGIEKFLSYFNFLYLPISKLAFKINSILRFFPLYVTVEYKSLKAAASRGIDYRNLDIIKRFKLFVKVHKNVFRITNNKSKEIAECSEMRLFDLKQYRTNYRTNKVTFNDIFFLIFHIVLIYAYLVEGGIL